MMVLASAIHAQPAVAPVVRPGIPMVAPEVRTVRVPGTVVEFDLVRVPMRDVLDAGELWVARHEVTWDLYDIYLYALDVPEGDADVEGVTRPSKPYVPPDRGMGHSGFPAMGMTRQAAEAFCEWLSARTGMRVRLPTPAEFERYAIHRPGIEVTDVAWTLENSERTTHPVGTRAMNHRGLHDTLGNVAEWVMTDDRRPIAMGGSYRERVDDCTPRSSQQQARAWNQSDPQIPKSQWWLADCSWVGFRFVTEQVPEAGADNTDRNGADNETENDPDSKE